MESATYVAVKSIFDQFYHGYHLYVLYKYFFCQKVHIEDLNNICNIVYFRNLLFSVSKYFITTS